MVLLNISPGPVIRGEYEKMKQILEDAPKDAQLVYEHETYCSVQSRAALKTFKLLINDPRFVFDDLFIARQLYFSALSSRELVMRHPKFLKVVRARPRFMDYFYERYGPDANRTHIGMLQRYLQVDNAMRYRKKQDNLRLAFILYPALTYYARNFVERYYAPGGPGYYKGKASFEAALQVP